MEKKVVELFAGVGGFRVGLNHISSFDENGRAIENATWEFVWANQWEPSTNVQHAFDCYCTRFGEENHSNVDIALVDKSEIPDHSLLVGGFPCQDYSVARTKSGEKGIEGKKGVLFWQISEILEVKESPFVLLENVDRLLKSPSNQRGRDFGIMLRTFSDLNYNVEWRVLNAAEYGFAQKRRRVFIFAWKRTTGYNDMIKTHDFNEMLLSNGLFARAFPVDIDNCDNKYVNEVDISVNKYSDTVQMTKKFENIFQNAGVMIDGKVYNRRVTPLEKSPKVLREILDRNTDLEPFFLNDMQLEKFKKLRGSKKELRERPDGTKYFYTEGSMSEYDSLDSPGRTMLTSEASINRSTHIIIDEETGRKRFITPIEAEKMQEFPENWTNTGMPQKRRYFMMGNALVTGIISELEPFLSTIIENEK